MARLTWLLLVAGICLPVALLATGALDGPADPVRAASLSDDDREMAWLHTSTNGTTWERFVAGLVRTQMVVPGLSVDDTNAFNEATTGVPEVVLSREGVPGRLRVRWYKLTTDATTERWVNALAERGKPPLAVIGGGSSDRAAELALALDRRKGWSGDRPLLFITTATADEVEAGGALPKNLIDVYDDLAFRFCFTNRQMAEAVLDFTLRNPELLATREPVGLGAVASGALLYARVSAPPRVLSVFWRDDPFSTDLHRRFGDALLGKGPPIETWEVRYSIGGFATPNFYEAKTAQSILSVCREEPGRRILLVLPTVTQPARRLLRAITEGDPTLRDRLVVVTGDGIPVNAFLRDGEFAWPIHAMPVPVVLFTHNDPVGWDMVGGPPPPPGYELTPPNSTEDVLHFTEIGRTIADGVFGTAEAPGLVAGAEALRKRFHARRPTLFEESGERRGDSGEYVVLLKPLPPEGEGPEARLEVYTRTPDRGWRLARKPLAIDQRFGPRGLAPAPPVPPGTDRAKAPHSAGGRG